MLREDWQVGKEHPLVNFVGGGFIPLEITESKVFGRGRFNPADRWIACSYEVNTGQVAPIPPPPAVFYLNIFQCTEPICGKPEGSYLLHGPYRTQEQQQERGRNRPGLKFISSYTLRIPEVSHD